ncbi:DUF1800 domain-containing protein [Candidatus Entotheonella palauensis]|uniref:DUF1800 domain-containing protein n=1 Tax=Candidatus Entotheonella gemina TaxID=1429439 RepID=W4MBX4_9BACT|nr:DUF1800 domain-containing protein [Candidatus Entotheonella palauensis]ETX07147.1 MAG: hypothetical protein ETSY2_12905 [Candidatus Entotheonella gemina]
MADKDIALMAHLMRRAGFGATREELEARVAQGYEATVEDLLHPEAHEAVDTYDLLRYHPWAWKPGTIQGMGASEWMYYMVNTQRPLEEKMVLFWHQVFATGVSKVDHYDEIIDQIAMFRDKGMGDYRELLMALARDPAMIYWLDNCENHGNAVNENWGRELLELFSMGVGNYTEDDVRECSRAFTGWTMSPKLPRFPMGRFDWHFEYKGEDHDDGEKTFLGHTGRFNGEDIINIVCQQPATAQFMARHLYNFFVADEAQVPAWSVTPPRDPEAIETLAQVFTESNYDMRSVLRVLFNSDFFKEARFAKLKSPAEVVIGTLRLVGGEEFPAPGIGNLSRQVGYMGQELLNPPSVEGWHTGTEWINSGSLMRRINFTANLVGDVNRPGVQAILNTLRAQGELSPEALVDTCLDLMGPLDVNDATRQELIRHTSVGGPLTWDTAQASEASTQRVGELLQLIVSLRDYQFA